MTFIPSPEKEWFVYILEATASTGRVTVHVGISLCVEDRMKDHATGKVKATNCRAIRLLGYTGPMGKAPALRMERELKTKTAAVKRRTAEAWKKAKEE